MITDQKPRLYERPDWSLFPQPVLLGLFQEGAGDQTANLARNPDMKGTLRETELWVSGKFGPAVDLNGSSSYIEYAPLPETFWGIENQFTLVASIYADATNGFRTIASKRIVGGNTFTFYFIVDNGKLSCAVGAFSIESSSDETISINAWHQLVAVFTGSLCRLYIDGTEVTYATQDAMVPVSWDTEWPLLIGKNSVWNEWWDGRISHFSIYNIPLTSQQIFELSFNPSPWFRRDPIELRVAAQVAVGDDYVRTMDDNMGIGDVRTDVKTFSRILTENLGVADASDRSATYPRILAESLDLSDTFSKSLGYARSEAETLGISDLMARSQIQARVIADDIGLLDLMQKGEIITFAENMGVTDSMLRLIAYISNPSDSVGIADDMIRVATALRTISDDVGMLDEQTIEHITDLVKAAWAFMLMKKH